MPSACARRTRQRPITCPIPWNAPHATNVHPAPCHNPPSSIVIMMFTAVRTSPCRLPPSGMYR